MIVWETVGYLSPMHILTTPTPVMYFYRQGLTPIRPARIGAVTDYPTFLQDNPNMGGNVNLSVPTATVHTA